MAVINDGYRYLDSIESEYTSKAATGEFNADVDIPVLSARMQVWGSAVNVALQTVFPTDLEWNYFKTHEPMVTLNYSGIDQQFATLRDTFKPFIGRLHTILNVHIGRYTDLPIKERLYVEDIDSFQKVRDVNPGMVSAFLKDGYLNLAEDTVQLAFESVLNVSFHKKDWGGEGNDLYTANVIVNGMRRSTAFLLKGHGLRKNVMEISNCGKNGDQVIRLFQSPADLYVIQFVGNISEAVIQHSHAEIARLKTQNKEAHVLIMDGQDTARVLHAYGKL